MFRKTAKVESVGVFSADSEGHLKAAGKIGRSFYADGSSKLDVKALLAAHTEEYDISPDPKDYLFEAIRANTTNCPNENHDAFHKSELLRFDHAARGPVYMTYVGKPHHVNHRTEDPRRARGIILDAHYNDDAPALETCPGCHAKTADKRMRDATGIHCKCGAVVKDEFVEILVAVDVVKDPVLADGIRTGALNAGSMGCNCAATECNVCSHIAYSRPEFCAHIRAGNKGSLWQEEANGTWSKIDKRTAEKMLSGARMWLSPDFCQAVGTVRGSKVHLRKAYEKCLDVEFDEYSRVDQPADPKAKQREVLKAAGKTAREDLCAESEALLRSQKTAQVPVDAETTFEERLPDNSRVVRETQPDGTTQVTIMPSGGPDALDELGAPDALGAPEVSMDDLAQESMGGPPGAPPPSAGSFGLAPQPGAPPGAGAGGTRMPPGVSPPGAAGPRGAARGGLMFEKAYENWTVDVTARGNTRILTPNGDAVALVRAARRPRSNDDRREIGKAVLGHLLSHGLVATVKGYGKRALKGAKLASLLDSAVNDMSGTTRATPSKPMSAGGAGDGPAHGAWSNSDKAHKGGDSDMAREDASADGHIFGDAAPDHKRDVGSENSVLNKPDDDLEDDRKGASVGSDSILDNAVTDKKAFRVVAKSWMAQNKDAKASDLPVWLAIPASGGFVMTREGEAIRRASGDQFKAEWMALDRAPPVVEAGLEKHTARLRKLYEGRLAAQRTDLETQAETAGKAAVDKFARALRIIAARQRLGLESCLMKDAVASVLANDRVVGADANGPLDYVAMSDELSIHLTESAWADDKGAHINDLIERAATLAAKSPEYLKDAQADLQQRTQRIAHVTQPEQVGVPSEAELVAEEARRAARQGNLQLGPSPADDRGLTQPSREDKRLAMRAALGGTRTDTLTRQISSQ